MIPGATDPERIRALLADGYGLAGTLTRLDGENENYLLLTAEGERFVLKIGDEAHPSVVQELEHAMVEHLVAGGFAPALPRTVLTRRGVIEAMRSDPGRPPLRGRLLRFVSGTAWMNAGPPTPARLAAAGTAIAELALGLADFIHPAMNRAHRWDLTAAGALRDRVTLVEDPDRRRLLDRAFMGWAAVRPELDMLPRGMIHGDLNDENFRVEGDRLVGVLDFGDCLVNPLICDLAIALTYLVLDEPSPLEAAAEIVAAYHRVRPLTTGELEVLFPLMLGRLAVSLAVAAERHRRPDRRPAWFVTEERAWQALIRYAEIDPLTAADRLAAGTGQGVYTDRGASREELLRRRRSHFCDALSLTYREPLKFIRGRAQYLFDERGRPCLDLYNNVCHVGHCHPRVVAAGQRQLARLNTNTRYLYDEQYEYAERLCATLPEPLRYCFFVNSGSEANELALRLAFTHTRRRDVLVLDNAYHGHTNTLVAISPYKFMGRGGAGRPEPWVHVVPIPDGYRGLHKGQGRDAGTAYGDDVGRVVAGLERPPAAFIAESLPSCGGQIIPPAGYFETAFRHVRAAGGVCILDEVQVGFGRVGHHFWGFQLQEVVPDIVVMGKPIGNGHPLGAVVTTPEIAASFAAAGMEFFSTFGGNPVSCAIGRAVLDVVCDEGLQARALAVGTVLRDGLVALMDRHPLVGDVRGVGLFIGIELVRDRRTLEPATGEAAEFINRLRRRRILVGTDGPYDNVIKIKGPLVLTEADAALAIRAMDEVLRELEAE